MKSYNSLTVIGRAEQVQFLDHGTHSVPAKVDTGADISSVWASEITERDGVLQFVLFSPESKYYTAQRAALKRDEYRLTRVANSFGNREMRYVVKLRIGLLGRSFKASFTLADRSGKIYPVLLGRRLLKNKFIVNVAQGKLLLAEERAKLCALRSALELNEN